jgi:hypothetical protein
MTIGPIPKRQGVGTGRLSLSRWLRRPVVSSMSGAGERRGISIASITPPEDRDASPLSGTAVFCGNCGNEVPTGKGCRAGHGYEMPQFRWQAVQHRHVRVPQRWGFGKLLLLSSGISLAPIILFAGLSGKARTALASPVSAKPPEALTWMGAAELQAAYHRNEFAADAALKGRRLGVMATVESIDKNFLDQHYLSLAGGDNMFEQVQASFSDEHLSELTTIQKGQAIRISCEVRGEILSSISLKNCQSEAEPEPAVKMAISADNPYRLEGNYPGWPPQEAHYMMHIKSS